MNYVLIIDKLFSFLKYSEVFLFSVFEDNDLLNLFYFKVFFTFNIATIYQLGHEKTSICICENKDADQHRGNRKADQCLVFATWIVQFLYFLNPKFPASSHLLCLYSSVCFKPVRKPHCLFSHEAAHIL